MLEYLLLGCLKLPKEAGTSKRLPLGVKVNLLVQL